MPSLIIGAEVIGPLLGLVLEDVREAGLTPAVYYVPEKRFLSGIENFDIPPWAGFDDDLLQTGLEEEILHRYDVVGALGLGMNATEHLTRFLSHIPMLALLLPGELDFSLRRKNLNDRFQHLCAQVEALLFLHDMDMSKAGVHGSTVPHFLWSMGEDFASKESQPSDGSTRVALIHSGLVAPSLETSDASLAVLTKGFEAHDIEFDWVPANQFFWYSDLLIGRSVTATARLRMRHYSDAIVLDADGDSLAAQSLLSSLPTRSFALPGLEHELLAMSYPTTLGTAPNLVEAIAHHRTLDGFQLDGAFRQRGRTFKEIFSLISETKLAWFHEDFGEGTEAFNLFVTVSPIENRSDGARPQRIRQMYLAMMRTGLAIQLNFSNSLLYRRIAWVQAKVRAGATVQYVYGENSTSPVPDREAVVALYRLIDWLKVNAGSSSLWFVRDLHWLDANIGMSAELNRGAIIERGIFELDRISRSFGAVVAPSEQSAVMFQNLLAGRLEVTFEPGGLPPALSPQHSTTLIGDPNDGAMTFIYSGGIGSAYVMNQYLDAVASILRKATGGVYFDFQVRTGEQALLQEELDARGVGESSKIRVLSGEFHSYFSRSASVTGVLLLDSNYGAAAFPFKSTSYLERHVPIMCFKDSVVDSHFGKYGVTIPVPSPSVKAIEETILRIVDGPAVSGDWETLWERENWNARWSRVRSIAHSGSREFLGE